MLSRVSQNRFCISNARDSYSTVIHAPSFDPDAVRTILAHNRAHVSARLRRDGGYSISERGEKIRNIERVQRIAFDFFPPSLSSYCDDNHPIHVSFEPTEHNIGEILEVRGTHEIVAVRDVLKSIRVNSQFAEYKVEHSIPSCRFFITYKGCALKPPMKQLIKCVIPYDLSGIKDEYF